MVNWIELKSSEQLLDLVEKSALAPVLFFKHSTRCGISRMVLKQIESEWSGLNKTIIPVYLDLLKYRQVSNEISEKFGVQHESPQVIVIRNGESVYSASHGTISTEKIKTIL